MSQRNDDVYIVGISVTGLGKFPSRSVKSLTSEAVLGALQDAGCQVSEIEAAWYANTRQGILEGQNTIRGQCALRSFGLQGIPITNVENACASSSSALRQAVAHLRAGMCDVALVAGVEKMFFPDRKEAMLKAFLGGADIHLQEENRAWLDQVAAGCPPPADYVPPPGPHSFFMDYYAAVARDHMSRFGTTERQIAVAASKNHYHSTFNPLAQYRHELTPEEVLEDVPVAWPLTRAMCAPISDGGAAAIVCNHDALGRFDASRAIRVAAIAQASSSDRDLADYDHHIGRMAALRAYEDAGLGPEDMDVAEVHDACAFAEILQVENLGFCPRGEGGPFTESGMTRLGGAMPVNPSGGLVSKGHPVAATGLIQLHELVTQLRGAAGSRQVEGARFGIAENGGGFWGVEEAATLVTVLEGPAS